MILYNCKQYILSNLIYMYRKIILENGYTKSTKVWDLSFYTIYISWRKKM